MSRPTRLVMMILATYVALDLLERTGLPFWAQLTLSVLIVAAFMPALDAIERAFRSREA